MVINSNILHYGAAAPECILHSLVFSPALITGNEEFVFAKKYMQPLLSCHSFSGYCIKAGDREDLARWFHLAFEALAQDSFGFEFIVRENLSRICLFLYGEFKPQADAKSAPLNQDNLRIGRMLAYIHKNFANDISLAEISGIADISERECLRCFQKTIQLSPIQYLLKYRIMQGAEMLLKSPGCHGKHFYFKKRQGHLRKQILILSLLLQNNMGYSFFHFPGIIFFLLE